MVRARDRNDDLALATSLCFLATTEVLAGDYAAAAAAASEADAVAAWYDWPPHPWRLEPRCELLIRGGDLAQPASSTRRFPTARTRLIPHVSPRAS